MLASNSLHPAGHLFRPPVPAPSGYLTAPPPAKRLRLQGDRSAAPPPPALADAGRTERLRAEPKKKCKNCASEGHQWWDCTKKELKPELAAMLAAKGRPKGGNVQRDRPSAAGRPSRGDRRQDVGRGRGGRR